MPKIKELQTPKTICAVCNEVVNRSDIGAFMFAPLDGAVPTLGICTECLRTLGELVHMNRG